VATALDYARTDENAIKRQRRGWAACIISIALSLLKGSFAIEQAFYFRLPTGMGAGYRDPYWFLDKLIDEVFIFPVLYCFAIVACVVAWKRKTGAWWAMAALLIGVAVCVGAVCTYP
jgi:hypothetical protein